MQSDDIFYKFFYLHSLIPLLTNILNRSSFSTFCIQVFCCQNVFFHTSHFLKGRHNAAKICLKQFLFSKKTALIVIPARTGIKLTAHCHGAKFLYIRSMEFLAARLTLNSLYLDPLEALPTCNTFASGTKILR